MKTKVIYNHISRPFLALFYSLLSTEILCNISRHAISNVSESGSHFAMDECLFTEYEGIMISVWMDENSRKAEYIIKPYIIEFPFLHESQSMFSVIKTPTTTVWEMIDPKISFQAQLNTIFERSNTTNKYTKEENDDVLWIKKKTSALTMSISFRHAI